MPEQSERPTARSRTGIPDAWTLAAFVGFVIIGGGNAVAVRFSNVELPPFWGAGLRFGAAAIIFWALLLARRLPVPRGKPLASAMLYGAIAIGASYSFLYWGLLEVEASVAIIILSLGPLFTTLLAVLHRIEPFRWRGLIGALVALVGVAIGMGAEFGGSPPVPYLAALVLGVVCIAEGTVLFKFLPSPKPLPTNAVAFTTGAAVHLLVSAVAGEDWFLPSDPQTVAAYGYLVVFGAVGLFYLYLTVLSNWTASATSYGFLLLPFSTIPIASVLADERVTLGFLAGGAVALAGVWIGAFGKAREKAAAQAERVRAHEPEPGAEPALGRCDAPHPGCA
jgi:drug/metabolite transporter (DMT)-like permease